MLKLNGLIFATELILRTLPIIFLSMSSKLLPCVSGTQNTMKKKPTTQTHPNSQNVPCAPIKSENIWLSKIYSICYKINTHLRYRGKFSWQWMCKPSWMQWPLKRPIHGFFLAKFRPSSTVKMQIFSKFEIIIPWFSYPWNRSKTKWKSNYIYHKASKR